MHGRGGRWRGERQPDHPEHCADADGDDEDHNALRGRSNDLVVAEPAPTAVPLGPGPSLP